MAQVGLIQARNEYWKKWSFLRILSLLMVTGVSSFLPISSPHSYVTRSHCDNQSRCNSSTGRLGIIRLPAIRINDAELVGEDAAKFSLEEQSLIEWTKFSVATGTVLAIVAYAWFLPSGPQLGNTFLESVQSTFGTTDPAVTIFGMLMAFAVAHSGLAALRPAAEEIVGARAWRVVFAVVSLPLSLSCISYFVNHAHEGAQLWNLPRSPELHNVLFLANFVSFLLLYPSTFNLLEIAAIEKPQVHLWETGVARITRHPQAMGQILWCAAHTASLGTSTAVAASSVLVAHHLFSVWHGDKRLRESHGEAAEIVIARTSVVPFLAILEGRQVLPDDYYKEFLRGPYILVVGGTLAAYVAHPYMMAGAALLRW
mmetsp:Transcript_25685/g.51108  ORF Transcript_25685/g.51108 Transcript_25685/m.51108 type:complete len:370 (-) Transcript_25685:62-1171(-)